MLHAVQHWQRSVQFGGIGGAHVDAQLGKVNSAPATFEAERELLAAASPLLAVAGGPTGARPG